MAETAGRLLAESRRAARSDGVFDLGPDLAGALQERRRQAGRIERLPLVLYTFKPRRPTQRKARCRERPPRLSRPGQLPPRVVPQPAGGRLRDPARGTGIHQAEDRMAGLLRQVGAPAESAQFGVAFSDSFVLILRDAVRFADGSLGTYLRSVPPEGSFPGVVVLPIWQGHVLLVRHFRHATREWHLELPRGFGTDPETSQAPGASWQKKSARRKSSSAS